MRIRAFLALAAVSSFLAAPLAAPSCAQVQAMACCSTGADECAGMTSVEACCRAIPVQGDHHGLLAQTAAPDPSRNRTLALAGAPASPSLVEARTAVLTAAGITPAPREDRRPAALSILRI